MLPTAANAGFYAEIVAEGDPATAGGRPARGSCSSACRRRGQDIAEVVDRAQAEVYDVTERRTSEGPSPARGALQPTMDELDSIASRGGISLACRRVSPTRLS